MKFVIADCSAVYSGRGETTLARGVRAIMIKTDGSVSIHNDVSNKPLNYMKVASFLETTNNLGEKVWSYEAKDETLLITIHELVMETEKTLIDSTTDLEREGTEKHLQIWLSEHPEVLGLGYTVVGLEYQTGKGPVDLLVLDPERNPVAVEVKRVAMLGAVDQCRRYIDGFKGTETRAEFAAKGLFSIFSEPTDCISLNAADIDPPREIEDDEIDFSKITGMIAAIDIRPKTLEWAAKHNIATVNIPANWREIP